MITFHRRKEAPPFLSSARRQNYSRLSFLHATLRQGLYRYFAAAGRKRALVPDYAPEGVIAPLRAAGLEIRFYAMPLDLRLDAETLRADFALHRPDVFVYIHHFGVYLESNVAAVRAALPEGVLFLEDFAHTLPCAEVAPAGDIALFAFPKLLGVAEGSLLWFANRGLLPPGGYAGENDAGRILSARMAGQLVLEDWMARLRASPATQRLLRFFLGKRASYYDHLLAHYREIGGRASEASLRALEAVDLAAVARRRKELAALYLRGLEPRFLLAASPESCLRQALLAFPVRVDDQDRFHAFLARGGVQGYRLTDRWWFAETPPSPLYHRHYLLPLGHRLSDGEVGQVIARVNAYPGG